MGEDVHDSYNMQKIRICKLLLQMIKEGREGGRESQREKGRKEGGKEKKERREEQMEKE